jgi:hypothetical protein
MTLSTVWITSTAFTLSCAIAWLRKQSSLPASLLKSAIFLTFAYAMYAGMTMYGGTTR